MESQRISMVRTRPTPGRATQLLASLFGLLILCVCLSQSARAANDAIIDCDRLESNLRSLDLPAVDLPLETGTGLANPRAELLERALDSEATVPVLRLTPRIADVMREVFDTLPNAEDGATAEAEIVQEPANERQAPLVNAPAAALPVPANADESDPLAIPRYQRQMYRTDI